MNSRVIWTEGMFLRPQHYQQFSRFIENYIEDSAAATAPFSWGFASLRLDQKQLGLGKVGIDEVRGVMPDGTPFSMPNDNVPPSSIDIPGDVRGSLVFLCLPLRRRGTALVEGRDDENSLSRLELVEREVDDDSTVGGGSASIQMGELRFRLMLEHEHRDNYTCLGLGRITEVRQDGSVVMDDSYVPPLLQHHASQALRGFVKDLRGRLRHRATALAGRVQESGRGGVSEIAGFLMLQMINRYLPIVEHFDVTATLHPESLFRMSVSLAGELATFTSSDRLAPEFPTYNHADLQQCFDPVYAVLREYLDTTIDENATNIPLQERRFGVRVASINDQTLLDSATFVLAIAADLPADEIRKRLPAQIKIGSVEMIRQLVNRALPGVMIRSMPVAPRQIPYHAGNVYFELDHSSGMWDDVRKARSLALHIAGDYPELKLELWAIRR
ncbi:MAG: type VI secretion system baseplate subunit TssK [Pseudomonadota bacterium]